MPDPSPCGALAVDDRRGRHVVGIVALPAVQAEFGVARSEASLPYTMTMIGFGVGGVLMGRLPTASGHLAGRGRGDLPQRRLRRGQRGDELWQFTLAQALFVGVASSVTFGPLLADTSLWFTRRRGMAVAIFASGNYLADAFATDHPALDRERGLAPGLRRHRPALRGSMLPLILALRRQLAPTEPTS